MAAAKHECVWRILAHATAPGDTRVLVGCRCTKTKIEKRAGNQPDMCHDERVR